MISINNINIKKIVVSDKVSFDKKGFKHFIGYKDSKKIRSLCLLLPEMSACWWDFDKIKYMSFSIIDDELLEEYNEVWQNVSNSSKKGFDREPVYDEKYLKTKCLK